MARAWDSASSGESANLTPPAFIRPPVRTWDFTTVGPSMPSAIRRASSAVVAKPWGETGMPALATIWRDSYSKKRIAGRNPIGAAVFTWGMRLVLLTLVLLSSAAPASAARLSLEVTPREGAVLGRAHRLTGALTQGGAPAPGQVVLLRTRPHPYDDPFETVKRAVTDASGRYSFALELERNHEVRVRTEITATPAAASSRVARAYVFPRARLSARTLRRDVVQLTQTLTVPPDVVLRAPTRFYLGRSKASTAAFVKGGKPRRVRAGHFVARVTVRVPAAYRGRFSYAACFRSTKGAGLGDPRASCPAHRYRF